jgi:hypothetical protein
VIGGVVSGASTATVEAYTPTTNNWATLPSLGTGAGWISTMRGPDGRIFALGGLTYDATNSTFTVRNIIEAYGPVLTLGSAHGSAGSMQGLMGSNFAANAVVSIYFGTQLVGTAQTDASGALPGTVTYKIPTVAAGSYQVKVIDNKSAYPVYSSFTVQ